MKRTMTAMLALCLAAGLILPASAPYIHFSSSMAREMIRYRQPLERYLPPEIAADVAKIAEQKHIGR